VARPLPNLRFSIFIYTSTLSPFYPLTRPRGQAVSATGHWGGNCSIGGHTTFPVHLCEHREVRPLVASRGHESGTHCSHLLVRRRKKFFAPYGSVAGLRYATQCQKASRPHGEIEILEIETMKIPNLKELQQTKSLHIFQKTLSRDLSSPRTRDRKSNGK
jgi:hypothetical protein